MESIGWQQRKGMVMVKWLFSPTISLSFVSVVKNVIALTFVSIVSFVSFWWLLVVSKEGSSALLQRKYSLGTPRVKTSIMVETVDWTGIY